jgi:L-malate glycosyltransferase
MVFFKQDAFVKIAILCHPSAGGSGVVATELALALVAAGHQVHLVATQMPFRLSAVRLPNLTSSESEPTGEVYFHEIANANYPLFDQPLTTLAAVNTLCSVIEEYGIDVVHAHYAIPHASSAIQAREIMGGVAVVTTLHGTDVTLVGLESAFLRTTRHAIEQSDGVTAVSNYLANHTRTVMGVQKEISVINNWVDAERFAPLQDSGYRARFALPGESLLVHTSNFRPVKRTLDVVEIFAKVSREKAARLLMVGDGPERLRCLELAKELGVSDRVHFIGTFPNVEMILGVADLFLLPSSQESFGLAALEAMSCGVPVISSDAGGLPEVNAHGETGFVLPIGDVDGMTAAALQALQTDTLEKMRLAARSRAVTTFSPARILPQYVSVYEAARQLEE